MTMLSDENTGQIREVVCRGGKKTSSSLKTSHILNKSHSSAQFVARIDCPNLLQPLLSTYWNCS